MELNQYLDVFIEESREHLQNVNDTLLQLEKNPTDLTLVNEIFRSAHTLKGMSATMGYEDLANLTHKMENVLDGIRNHKIEISAICMDTLIESVEALEKMVESIASGGDGKHDVTALVTTLLAIEKNEESQPVLVSGEQNQKNSMTALNEYEKTLISNAANEGFNCYHFQITLREDCMLKAVRVYMCMEIFESHGDVIKSIPSTDVLENEEFGTVFQVYLLTHTQAEEIQRTLTTVSEVVDVQFESIECDEIEKTAATVEVVVDVEPVVAQKNSSTPSVVEQKQETKQNNAQSAKTIRVNIERLDILMNLFEELVIDRGRLEQISNELNHGELNETVERMSRVSGDLQNIILNMRMVPVETVFNRFPRMVRQIAKDLGKSISLEIIGADTELDRSVIDEIGDPLVHLIRNAVDHGLELPEKRRAAGKSETGTLTLKAYHSGNHVFIDIMDDGNGISKEKVLRKAIERGVVTESMALSMSDKQVYELILASGFSTADTISDISGRGVGLDVVKNTIESLGGAISIDSTEGFGSTFSIQLPLTLSIISVMLVEIQSEKFAIPLASIIETAMISKSDVYSAHGKQVIDFRGKILPLLFLQDIFEVPQTLEQSDHYAVLIVRKGEKYAALVVDTFIGQQEIVLKSLGTYLTNVHAISGATILGNGQVALIVDCNALIK
ncbi:MAG: chemotaxis protein CheW [Bacilli bacterium]